MNGCGRCWLVMELQRTSRRICRLESLHCLWKRRSRCFAVYFKGVRMCLLGDGSAQRQARAAINLCALGSGTVSIAIRKNSNAPNVRTASFSHWDMMTFIVTLKARIQMGAMSLEYMQFYRTIPASFFAAISMTRAVSMAIRRTLWPTWAFVAIGGFQRISSVQDRATARMYGFCLMNQSKLEQLEVLVMQF